MLIHSCWAGVFCIAGLLVFGFELGAAKKPIFRYSAAALCIALTLRYLCWRVRFSLPHHQNLLQNVWAWSFLLVEVGALLSSVLTCFFLSRTLSRTATADASQVSPLLSAPTDVFVATYNESYEILERTLVTALAIDHRDFRVWLLDDGDRSWARELADSLGVGYVARHKGKHAKAGNVNNGVKHAISTGRRPEFFLLLDADFAASRAILRRTLGLFEDPTIGIVQTPQHFFNPDPIQSNLFCSSVWPDEQRFFFNSLLPSKDAWGAAFCCGTSAVFRVAAFEAAGGMATETVTEDMLTTFKFGEFGFRTVFLNERLSLGLSPESITDFMSQRSRWCLGAIQQVYTRWSSVGRGRVSVINRLSFLDGVLYWIFGAAYRLMLLAAPALWWLTGTSAIHASLSDIAFWMGPMVTGNFIYMAYLSDKRSLPIISDITQVLTAFVICRTVVAALVRPFGRPFKVTAKGLSTTGVTVQWKLLWPFAAMASVGLVGMLLNVSRFSQTHGDVGYVTAIVWTVMNTIVLALAALTCVEVPHRRRDERFSVHEAASVRLVPMSDSGDARGCAPLMDCTIQDISLGGAAIRCSSGWGDLCGPAHLLLAGGDKEPSLSLPFTVVRRSEDLLTINFHTETWIRHALIRKLFTGAYHKEIEAINTLTVFRTLCRTLFSSGSPSQVRNHSGIRDLPEAFQADQPLRSF